VTCDHLRAQVHFVCALEHGFRCFSYSLEQTLFRPSPVGVLMPVVPDSNLCVLDILQLTDFAAGIRFRYA
jgi:hypothetical protein